MYVAFLANEGLNYLSGLHFSQIHLGLGNPFQQPLPQLEYVLTGIKQVQSQQEPHTDRRLPITVEVLKGLRCQWIEVRPNADGTMLYVLVS